jgi:hypothetical protein
LLTVVTGDVLPELELVEGAAMVIVDCPYLVVSATLRAVTTARVEVVTEGAV